MPFRFNFAAPVFTAQPYVNPRPCSPKDIHWNAGEFIQTEIFDANPLPVAARRNCHEKFAVLLIPPAD